MAKRTGPSNPVLIQLIHELKKKAIDDNAGLWKRIATDLEKSSRQRRIVNLSRLNRFTKENEIIIVPGKVLGSGILNHSITIAAFDFSDGAVDALKAQKCNVLSIDDLMKKNPKTKDVRIIG
ncbi:50S ribosomal protein L18e [Candidatus Woesearchaeota archaeon]|jgi:large subunit ribosomal protein L18e|nr:50S ribosomal protein L18e [Candidatus Woesearchaeota archaeon]